MRSQCSWGVHRGEHCSSIGRPAALPPKPVAGSGSERNGKQLLRAGRRRRAARFRKERGYTQVELAEKMGLIQSLVSDCERGVLRLIAEMIARFALTLDVSADALLGLDQTAKPKASPRRRSIQRRLEALEKFPKRDQEALLRTIDLLLAKAS